MPDRIIDTNEWNRVIISTVDDSPTVWNIKANSEVVVIENAAVTSEFGKRTFPLVAIA